MGQIKYFPPKEDKPKQSMGLKKTYFTEYKFAAMLSAALSRIHVLPPLVDLNSIPLPPAAQASSCKNK